MKTKAFAALATLMLSTGSAYADPSILTCANGTMETAGDNLFVINILEDGLEVNFWESGFILLAGSPGVVSAKTRLGNLFLFEDAIANFSGEGETWTSALNGSMFYDEGAQTLTTALRFDSQPLRLETLDCKTIN